MESCFCVMVFVLGTFQEGRQEIEAGGGNAASARAPGRMDPHKAADDCRTRLSPSHQYRMAGAFGSEKKEDFKPY